MNECVCVWSDDEEAGLSAIAIHQRVAMQLPAENGAPVSLDGEGGPDSGASPQLQASGGVVSRVVSSGGKAPAVTTTSPTSSIPSSPGSPSKSAGGGAAGPREKPVKVLPCPRCESLNTKFCYYNNYSVTQPRHFCRQCQRYWTAGGTLRNVPVGGGSRKKNRHPRGGEPYLQQRTGLPSPTSTFGMPTSVGLQNVGGGHFQQMMAQDVGGFPQLNFGQQVPGGFAYHHPYGNMEPVEMGQQQVMYGAAAPQMHPPPQFFFPQQQEGGTAPFQNDMTGVVKTEFWPQHGIVPPSPPSGNPGKNGQRFESSMLLNLGLNSRPQQQQQVHPQQQQQQPQQEQPPQQAQSPQTDSKPSVGASITGAKNGSPPHGSSTIEEEGSTPTNGYSNNGYEEGDAVSSMWPNLHDMETIFQ